MNRVTPLFIILILLLISSCDVFSSDSGNEKEESTVDIDIRGFMRVNDFIFQGIQSEGEELIRPGTTGLSFRQGEHTIVSIKGGNQAITSTIFFANSWDSTGELQNYMVGIRRVAPLDEGGLLRLLSTNITQNDRLEGSWFDTYARLVKQAFKVKVSSDTLFMRTYDSQKDEYLWLVFKTKNQ